MATAFITGTNRGIGFELVRQYAAEGWRVHAASRHPQSCESIHGEVFSHHLDVADARQIANLGAELQAESFDLVINNAGVYSPETETLDTFSVAKWDTCVRVNALAPLLIARALLGSLSPADAKLVNISTRNASMALANDNGFGYGASKAALNAITKSLSVDLAARGVAVLAITPGWVRTDMGGDDADLGVEESVAGIRTVIAQATMANSGRFLAHDGEVVPW